MKSNVWLIKFNLMLIQIALILIKLIGIIDWSWWWVASPYLTYICITFSIAFAKGFADGVRK